MTAPITILGANLKGNLGDFAILEVMARSFRFHHPGIEVRFFHHANKPIDRTRYAAFLNEVSVPLKDLGAAPYVARPRWFRLLSRLPGTETLTRRIHNRLIQRVAADICHIDVFVTALQNSSLIVFAGGSQWGKANLNLNMLAQLTCAARINRVATFPFGISSVALDCNGPSNLGAMLSQLTPPIPVRDVISHRLLAEAGVGTEHVADCVFTAGDMFENLRKSSDDTARKVYVSVTRSGDTEATDIIGLFERLRNTGYEPVLFSSCEIEDRPLVQAVLDQSPEEYSAPVSWKEAVGLFAEAAFIITNRLHCLIFAALGGTAVIPIANRQKARAYAEDAGLDYAPGELVEITEQGIEAYAKTLDVVRSRQAAYRQSSAERTEEVIHRICGSVS